MIKKLFIACAAFVWTIALVAQNISVVNSSGSTKLYRTLQAAIEGADPNSVIYLPGGGFPIADSVKITKKLTIIGIGHKSSNNNVDGVTTISGNLFFNEGSSGSAVMACYITGDVYIGDDGTTVNDVLVKYCNLSKMNVKNSSCQGTIVSQNYIRSFSYCYNAPVEFSNNICKNISNLDGGTVSNNIITLHSGSGVTDSPLYHVINSNITSNIFFSSSKYWTLSDCRDNVLFGNMAFNNKCGGDELIDFSGISIDSVFVNYNGGTISPASDFHFKDEYKQYENQVGIYAGDGFNDKQLAPVPYIVAKKIDEQTDTAGKLNIKIRVKASGEE